MTMCAIVAPSTLLRSADQRGALSHPYWPAKTYTVDTLRALAAELGPEVRLFFVTGADAVLQILTWKDPHEVLALAELIAATRPGYDLAALLDTVPAAAGRVHVMEIPALAI